MIDPKASTGEILVHLVHPGVAAGDYHLSEGATLADLLRVSGISTTNQAIFVDGVPPDESLPLHNGIVVTLLPWPGEEPWRAQIPSFRDESLFQEYTEALKARRQVSGLAAFEA